MNHGRMQDMQSNAGAKKKGRVPLGVKFDIENICQSRLEKGSGDITIQIDNNVEVVAHAQNKIKRNAMHLTCGGSDGRPLDLAIPY